MRLFILAMDTNTMTVVLICGIALMTLIWFGLKYWMAMTKAPEIKDVPTPNIDRMNTRALETMTTTEPEQAEKELEEMANPELPDDLLAAVPESPQRDTSGKKPAGTPEKK